MSANNTSDTHADLRLAVATVASPLREAEGILDKLAPATDEQVVKDLSDSVGAASRYLDATERALAADAGRAIPVVLEFGTFVHEGFDSSDRMEELAQVGIAHRDLQDDTQRLERGLARVREAAGQLMLVIQEHVARHYAATSPGAAARSRVVAAAGPPRGPSITGPVTPSEQASGGDESGEPGQSAQSQPAALPSSSPSIPVTPTPSPAAAAASARARSAMAGRRKAATARTVAPEAAIYAKRREPPPPADKERRAADSDGSEHSSDHYWGSKHLIEAVQGLAVTLASQQYGRPVETSRGAGSYEAVADQMTATLDAFGLPHDGVQLGYEANTEYARGRLVDGLRRNFASRVRDGFTVYYRVDDPTPANAPTSSSQLLRGGALVSAELFGAEVTAFLATLDRLVPRTRFSSAIGVFDPSAARQQIKDELQRLTTTIRNPLGVNQPQADFQMRRVRVATIEYLELAEIIEEDSVQEDELPRCIEVIEGDEIGDELMAPTSIVRSEELRQDVAELFKLAIAMQKRIDAVAKGVLKGTQAAILEQALTAAHTSAATFGALLISSGTSALEQDLQSVYVGKTVTPLSLSQFLSWVQATAEPFTRGDNRAATLLPEDLTILADELDALHAAAGAFLEHGGMPRFSVRLPAPHRQLQELQALLEQAADAAGKMASTRS